MNSHNNLGKQVHRNFSEVWKLLIHRKEIPIPSSLKIDFYDGHVYESGPRIYSGNLSYGELDNTKVGYNLFEVTFTSGKVIGFKVEVPTDTIFFPERSLIFFENVKVFERYLWRDLDFTSDKILPEVDEIRTFLPGEWCMVVDKILLAFQSVKINRTGT